MRTGVQGIKATLLLGGTLQACHQIVELFPLHRDMCAQRLARLFGVSAFQGIYDGLMLGHGLRHAATKPQLLPTKRLEPFVQFGGFLLEKPVAGLLIDDSMKTLVLGIVTI